MPDPTGVLKAVSALVAVVITVWVAGPYVAFDPTEYVTVQLVVELVIMMVDDPEPFEQPPDAEMLTGKPEVAVGATVKLLPYGWLAGCVTVMV